MTLRDDVDTYGNRSRTYLTEFLAEGHIDGWMEAPSGFPDPALGEVTEVYIRWYVNPSFAPIDGSHKFIRIWDTRGGAQVGIRISWTQMHLTYDQVGTGSTPSGAGWEATLCRFDLAVGCDRLDEQLQRFLLYVLGPLSHRGHTVSSPSA